VAGTLNEPEEGEITDDYSEAQITALKTALGGVAVIVLLGFGATSHLPAEPLVAPAGRTSGPAARAV